MELAERPLGYAGPNLSPGGVHFRTRNLARDVFAFMVARPPRDNSGCIVGRRGALVIDAGINGAVAREIQSIVRTLTGKPILYLVNTNYHGDHTFGNYAFPPATEIVASRQTRESMTDLEAEKRIRTRNLAGDARVIEDVVDWRKPDTIFDDYLEIDLGGKKVELWHFGSGNTPGDTVVYSRDAKAAWTGNLIGHRRVLPMLLEGGPGAYLETLDRFQYTLDVRTIVPGHGPLGDARSFSRFKSYLWDLTANVHRALFIGLSDKATVAALQLDAKYRIPFWNPMSQLNPLLENLHRLNVLATYRALDGRRTTADQCSPELWQAGTKK